MNRVPVGRSAYFRAISGVSTLSSTRTKTRPGPEIATSPKRSCGLRLRAAAERMRKPKPKVGAGKALPKQPEAPNIDHMVTGPKMSKT
jgi:hypothetical protein